MITITISSDKPMQGKTAIRQFIEEQMYYHFNRAYNYADTEYIQHNNERIAPMLESGIDIKIVEVVTQIRSSQ